MKPRSSKRAKQKDKTKVRKNRRGRRRCNYIFWAVNLVKLLIVLAFVDTVVHFMSLALFGTSLSIVESLGSRVGDSRFSFKSWRKLKMKNGKIYYFDDPAIGGSGKTQYVDPRLSHRPLAAWSASDAQEARNHSLHRWIKKMKAGPNFDQFLDPFQRAFEECRAIGMRLQKDRSVRNKAFQVSKAGSFSITSCCRACAKYAGCKISIYDPKNRNCAFHGSRGSGLKITSPRKIRGANGKMETFHIYSMYKDKTIAQINKEVNTKIQKAVINFGKPQGEEKEDIRGHNDGPKVIDAFAFNHELDLLEIRLHELHSAVDVHILVESHHSTFGKKKPLHYELHRNDPRFRPFKDKIVHIVTRNKHGKTGCSLGFNHLNDMRDAIEEGLQKLPFQPQYKDIVVVGDADEIVSAQAIEELRNKWPQGDRTTVQFLMRWSFYGFFWQNRRHSQISHARLYGHEMEVRRQRREGRAASKSFVYNQPNGGWHCSWCFKPLEFQTKLEDAVCGDGVSYATSCNFSYDNIHN
jgi:hypothetical protein